MKHLLFYDYAPDSGGRASSNAAAHAQLYLDAHARGDVLMAGPWEDDAGAMGVFTSREAATRFVKEDPFVRAGVVRMSTIRDWIEGLHAPDGGNPKLPGGAKSVLFYEGSAAARGIIPLHVPEHREMNTAMHARGLLLMSGPIGNGDAVAVLTSPEAAAEFVRLDPFVRHGVVERWYVRIWNELLNS